MSFADPARRATHVSHERRTFTHCAVACKPERVSIPERSCPCPKRMTPNAAISTARILSASPRRIFAAFEQPDQLARWWGPKDFTNTFSQFEFKPAGGGSS